MGGGWVAAAKRLSFYSQNLSQNALMSWPVWANWRLRIFRLSSLRNVEGGMASLLKKPLILYDPRTDKPVKRKW
ncbi:MAG TPA: hypothetical protein DC058_24590 [Planctomycetaceae bacterium]|nr:hypothetical protein [Planctomycetaceae bacterium]HBC64379.1 hypothetical protein [Planctomycetaceae bacterium]